jgi:hypothetical protein
MVLLQVSLETHLTQFEKYRATANYQKSSSVVYLLACLPLDPKFAGLDPADVDTNPQHAFFRRRSKASAPCHKILWHVKNICGV